MDSYNNDYGEDNSRNMRLVIGFARSNIEIERATQNFLAEYNITLAQFGVLEALYHLGDLKIGEIIEKTLSTSGNMTVVIRNLEKENYVNRVQAPDDGRASLICITGKGRSLIERIFPLHLESLARKFSRLTDSDKTELNRLMKKMNGIA